MSLPSSPSGDNQVGRSIATMAIVSVICGVLVAGLVLPFASLIGITTQNVAEGFHDLPLELQETPPAQRSTVLDVHGDPIAYFYDENRQDVSLDKVSPIMREAILAIEDDRFYEHGAIDIKGTIRAFINNQADENVQGGSSITQQLVKMILLSQADSEKERQEVTASDGWDGYGRKLRELKYAMAYEESHTKDQIFEDYLNYAYFGDGAYGIDEAANHYFSVEPSELKLKQAALLAGLVKNPSAYNPTQFPEAAADRRNTVLARMVDLDIITEERAGSIYNTPLGMDITDRPNGCVSTQAPFFCDYLQEWLLTEDHLGETRDERAYRLETAGLTIKSTIDLRYQEATDNAVSSHVYPTDNTIGALAMVEPGTGEVRALSQSRPMGRDKSAGQTYLNYTVPVAYGGARGFQPGSTFKSFVAAAALKKGYPTSTSFYSPTSMVMPNDAYTMCNGLHPAEDWPVASSTVGDRTFDMYDGTQLSVNTYYAQLEALVGVCPSVKMTEKLGIDIDTKGDHRDDVGPFTLGVSDVSPLAMANAYATFAARGKYCEAHPVTEILDRFGESVVTVPKDCERVFPRAVGDAVNDILRGVQEPGGFGYDLGNSGLNVDSAAKTGTTSSQMSVWYVGYTADLSTAAVFAGANQAGTQVSLQGQTVGGDYISDASGSGIAAPMWKAAMGVIQKWLSGEEFVPPDESKLGGAVKIVPDTGGMSIRQAKETLRNQGFRPTVGYAVNSAYAEGTVAYTSPGAGSEAYRNAQITIYPSTGYVPPPEDNDDGDNGGGNDDGGDNDQGGGNDGGPPDNDGGGGDD